MAISTETGQLRERVNREQKERGKMDNSRKRIEKDDVKPEESEGTAGRRGGGDQVRQVS